MGVAEASTREVEKKPYRNQTAGYVGVVKLDHLGGQVGDTVAPFGTTWLTDDEAKLTARASALPEDNPFVPKTLQFQNSDTGEIVEQEIAPLVLVSAEDGAPEDRFVPTSPILAPDAARIEAVRQDAADVLDRDHHRPTPTSPSEPQLASSHSAAVPPSHARPGAPHSAVAQGGEEDQGGPASWLEPEAALTEEPQAGNLQGGEAPSQETNAPEGASVAATASTESAAPGAQEEHAAHTEGGEETGAAATPAQAPAEGEFAQAEEVGSPDAPQQAGDGS